MRHSIEPRERRYIKRYGFLSFAKNFSNKYGQKLMNTAIKTGTNFNSKYGKKLADTAIKTGKDFAMIAGKKVVHKSAEATGDLIGNKIADRLQQSLQKNHKMKKYCQMKLIKKYQKRDIFLQKKNKRLLMN